MDLFSLENEEAVLKLEAQQLRPISENINHSELQWGEAKAAALTGPHRWASEPSSPGPTLQPTVLAQVLARNLTAKGWARQPPRPSQGHVGWAHRGRF